MRFPVPLASPVPLALLLAIIVGQPAQAADLTLAWDPNVEPNLAGYKLYYDVDSGVPYTGTQANEGISPIDVPLGSLTDPTAPSFTLTALPSCTTFFFAVTATDNNGLESGFSAELSAFIQAKPNPLSATADGAGVVHLAWNDIDSANFTTYRVDYDVDSGAPYTGTDATEGASPISVSASALDVHGLQVGTAYFFVVESVCPDGSVQQSDEQTATPALAGEGEGEGEGEGAIGEGEGEGEGAAGEGEGEGGEGEGEGEGAGGEGEGEGAVSEGEGEGDTAGGCACSAGSSGDLLAGLPLGLLWLAGSVRRRRNAADSNTTE